MDPILMDNNISISDFSMSPTDMSKLMTIERCQEINQALLNKTQFINSFIAGAVFLSLVIIVAMYFYLKYEKFKNV